MPPWGYSVSLESLLRKLWDSPRPNKQSTGLFVAQLTPGRPFESLPAQNKLGYMPPWGYSISLESLLRKLWDSPRPNKQSTGLFVTSLRRAGLSSPFWRKNKLVFMPPWGYSILLESLLRKLWDSPRPNKQSTGLFVASSRRADAFESPSGVKIHWGYMPPMGHVPSIGTPEGDSNPDLLIRSQSLYPAELLAHAHLKCLDIIAQGAQKSKPFFSFLENCSKNFR